MRVHVYVCYDYNWKFTHTYKNSEKTQENKMAAVKAVIF